MIFFATASGREGKSIGIHGLEYKPNKLNISINLILHNCSASLIIPWSVTISFLEL